MSEQPGFRDAVHVPYVVVICDQDASRGAKAWLTSEDMDGQVSQCRLWREGSKYDPQPDWHGVVDPFSVSEVIEAGTPFRLMIRKECFGRLRHDFEIDVGDRGGTATCHSVCDVF